MTSVTRRGFVKTAALASAAPLNQDMRAMSDRTSSLLFSDAPSPEIPHDADLYGWLIGGWELDVTEYRGDGPPQRQKGECHFTWALEGRIVQDVWIIPPQSTRRPDPPRDGSNRYGTTLRTYDPRRREWRITWVNPVTGVHTTLFARKQGRDIVQEGPQEDGSVMRWTFTDITDTSFRWLGEQSVDKGKTWQLGVEFLGKRLSSQPLR